MTSKRTRGEELRFFLKGVAKGPHFAKEAGSVFYARVYRLAPPLNSEVFAVQREHSPGAVALTTGAGAEEIEKAAQALE